MKGTRLMGSKRSQAVALPNGSFSAILFALASPLIIEH